MFEPKNIKLETDIIHENGKFWVLREAFKGRTVYYVMENVGTHSVRRDTFDLMLGRDRAITKCDERARERSLLAAAQGL
jgi:hypothetical protein